MTSYQTNMKAIRLSIFLTILTLIMQACSPSNKGNEMAQDDGPLASANEIEEIEEEPIKIKHKFSTAEEAIEYMNESPDKDRYAAGIMHKMAHDSLDYCNRLLNSEYEYFIIVDKGDMKVKLFDRYGVLRKSYTCACGKGFGNKRSRGDCRTPEGFFRAGKVQNSENWHYTDENGVRSENPGQYGPRFFRIVTPGFNSTGIHGTDAPWSVGGRRSHGCVRIKNENILELVKFVTKGMPVIVLPGKRDKEVNWREAHPELFPQPDSTEIKREKMKAEEIKRDTTKAGHAPKDSL